MHPMVWQDLHRYHFPVLDNRWENKSVSITKTVACGGGLACKRQTYLPSSLLSEEEKRRPEIPLPSAG